jgi:hypothetical protein
MIHVRHVRHVAKKKRMGRVFNRKMELGEYKMKDVKLDIRFDVSILPNK